MLCVKLQGRIQLDVGGIRFFTSQATLTAKRGFFRALCDGFAEVTRDGDGCIFIDRDGGAFRYVLLHCKIRRSTSVRSAKATLNCSNLMPIFMSWMS